MRDSEQPGKQWVRDPVHVQPSKQWVKDPVEPGEQWVRDPVQPGGQWVRDPVHCTVYSVQYVEKWVVRQPTRTGLVYVECKLAGVEIRYKKTVLNTNHGEGSSW